jgi:hypothetical protein
MVCIGCNLCRPEATYVNVGFDIPHRGMRATVACHCCLRLLPAMVDVRAQFAVIDLAYAG